MLVVAAEELVRTGLRMILDAEPDLDVVGTASDGRQAVAEVDAGVRIGVRARGVVDGDRRVRDDMASGGPGGREADLPLGSPRAAHRGARPVGGQLEQLGQTREPPAPGAPMAQLMAEIMPRSSPLTVRRAFWASSHSLSPS